MVNQLRHEVNSGSNRDPAHVASADCLADPLTKSSAELPVRTTLFSSCYA